ncbi:phosphodiester glycosidase family protein [Bacillus sp. S/N-304-OC-R1]|uniref:phosphodiester glycosidase family protein n=1 Tax=Bacillus sp. S/N-304-OC-R1 TaxID=2758034 RepID=UPI001C8D60D2|nr:phosphodiester glycosidase family protein [Bacillus sp. S/N-304-OC-R1]MBY0123507.1 phosphodiester glycosidase family protein [Bacillus sp. S/N-304-OC-R1]
MGKKWIVNLVVAAALILGLHTPAQASEVKVYWDGLLMVKGQVGKIKVLKPINLWKREGNKLVFTRVLKPGEQYRVYRYDDLFGGQYGLGGGYYITKIAGYVDYRTPSKKKLAELEAAYGGGSSQVKPIGKLSIGTVTEQKSKKIAPGVTETQLSVDSNRGKQKIYTVEYDGKTEKISLETALANGQMFGFETVASQANKAQTENKQVVAGINGDYFDKNGHPVDLMIQNGNIVSTSQTPINELAVFGITSAGKPIIGSPQLSLSVQINGQEPYKINSVNRTRAANHLVLYTPSFASSTRTNDLGTEVVVKIDAGQLNGHSVLTGTVTKVAANIGNAQLNDGEFVLSGHHFASDYLQKVKEGDKVEVKAEFSPSEWNDVVEAISGRYHLVKNGAIVPQDVPGVHPRSAIGIKADGGIVTAVVDGRTTQSVGLTLPEMASVMKDLGAIHAFTFDGGGSSTMVTRDYGNDKVTVVNTPSDGKERSVSNALLFISQWLKGPLNQLIVKPEELTLFAGATYKDLGITVKGMDQFYNAVPVTQPIVFSSPALKKNADGSYTVVTTLSQSEITVASGNISSKLKLNIINTLESIQVDEKDIIVEKNNVYTIQPKGIYKGKTVITDPALFKWSVTPNIGTINNKGEFKAGAVNGTGTITVSHGSVTAKINVTVGTPEPILLEGFEGGIANYKASGARYNSVKIDNETAIIKTGKNSVKLSYDFSGTSGTSGAYVDAVNPLAIKGLPKKIGMWVYGDGQGHWLRMQLKDANNQEIQLDFTKNLDWTGWKYVEAPVPQDIKTPLRIDVPVRYMEVNDANKNSGVIYIDQIQAVYK